ncbi:hypothetical protein [Nocardia wallacei]|uniref:Uncharacterized protein n=1 Tax=Nocardia wallacei TaxID=480035 RepID=A0A7G1KTC4_9NOCA|nr:hypothetical protein [Nocardia wallacei]BCK58352.1 hypothetical protein NWFMUON74_61240 [Nocardia wallacei]
MYLAALLASDAADSNPWTSLLKFIALCLVVAFLYWLLFRSRG